MEVWQGTLQSSFLNQKSVKRLLVLSTTLILLPILLIILKYPSHFTVYQRHLSADFQIIINWVCLHEPAKIIGVRLWMYVYSCRYRERGTAVEAVMCKASETSSKEHRREEDNDSYLCLHLYFSTAGQTLHLALLVSFVLRWRWLSISGSASLCYCVPAFWTFQETVLNLPSSQSSAPSWHWKELSYYGPGKI